MTRRSPRLPGGLLFLVGLFLLLLLPGSALRSQEPTPLEPQDALRLGNRAYRDGRLEQALELYTAGYRPGRRLLAYNAGTTAHHLDRLPLALLWYRRAARESDDDAWLRANRELVREQLAAPRHPPPGSWATLLPAAPWLTWLGVACAWLGLLIAWRRWGSSRIARLPEIVLALAGLLLAAGWMLPRRAPRPLVLTAPCDDAKGSLPAGAETWGRPAADDSTAYELTTPDGPLRCPASGVGEVVVLASSG